MAGALDEVEDDPVFALVVLVNAAVEPLTRLVGAEDDAEDADECYDAKQMVVNSTTAEEFEFAKAKMTLLCDD